jgi:uncharacterized repeat protein (TIGR01451 family)
MKMKYFIFDKARYFKSLVLLAMVITAYTGAINRGESLLWVICAVLLASLIIGMSWPYWLIRTMSVVRTGPESAQVGDTVNFNIEVTNTGRLPRFMIEVIDWLPFSNSKAGVLTPGYQELGVISYVGGGKKHIFDAVMVCDKRGYYRIGAIQLATSFPLGLFEVRKHRKESVRTLIIYPEMFQMISPPFFGALSKIDHGRLHVPEKKGTAEFTALREYQFGDNPRHIHWGTTARLNQLMIREFDLQTSIRICLILDMAADANHGNGRHSTLEYAITISASISRYADDNKMPFRLTGDGIWPSSTDINVEQKYFQNTLDKLAVIDSGNAMPYGKFLENFSGNIIYGETMIVFLSEPQERVQSTLQSIALLKAFGANVIAVVFDQNTFIGEKKILDAAKDQLIASLSQMQIGIIQVRKGDNLSKLFNV